MVTASRLDCYTKSSGVLINENFPSLEWGGGINE
jgi:hypothetical protein